MPTTSRVFLLQFLSAVFLFSDCIGSFKRYLSAKMAFSMTSWFH